MDEFSNLMVDKEKKCGKKQYFRFDFLDERVSITTVPESRRRSTCIPVSIAVCMSPMRSHSASLAHGEHPITIC